MSLTPIFKLFFFTSSSSPLFFFFFFLIFSKFYFLCGNHHHHHRTDVHWIDVGGVDNHHGFYLGMTVVPDGIGITALSLAPQSSPSGFLDLVMLHLPTGNVTKIYPLGNVSAPGVGLGKAGQLGYVLDASRKGTYVALVNIPNSFPLPYPGALDSWGLANVNLNTGKVTVTQLSPTILSGGTSISGVGLPKL